VGVQLSLEGRELARQAYAASVVTGVSGVSPSGGVQSSLRIPLQGMGSR